MLTKDELENMEQKLKVAFALSARKFEELNNGGFRDAALTASHTMAAITDALTKVDGRLREISEVTDFKGLGKS